MLADLEAHGLEAVRRYSRKFDDWDPHGFELTPGQIQEAIGRLDPQVLRDTDFCQGNVRAFARAQLATLRPLEVELRPGVFLGHRHVPVGAVGAYVPGGRYPMFGSAQMSIIPAKVAGVESVVACTPPVKGQGWYPATINAMKKAGAGNSFVTEAKRQLFGRCGIDLLAGPTEILVIADDAADPGLVACDLLGQAEHDPNSGVALICFSVAFARACLAELEAQLAVLPTREVAEMSWRYNGRIYIADNPEEAVSLADDYAPEHLELQVADADFFFGRLRNYGSLFIGEETTVAYGDKCIGTNHILPTSRSARYTGGLWVGKFLKTVTYQRMSRQASLEIGEVTERQCAVERMLAHGLTARKRLEKFA